MLPLCQNELLQIYFIFTYLKIYPDIKSVENWKYPKADIDSVQNWYGENHMELHVQKTFTWRQAVCFNYYINYVSVLRTNCNEDLGVVLDRKLHFHCHVDCVHSQALRTLGVIRYITYNLSYLDSPVDVYNVLVRSELQLLVARALRWDVFIQLRAPLLQLHMQIIRHISTWFLWGYFPDTGKCLDWLFVLD